MSHLWWVVRPKHSPSTTRVPGQDSSQNEPHELFSVKQLFSVTRILVGILPINKTLGATLYLSYRAILCVVFPLKGQYFIFVNNQVENKVY